MNKMRTIYAGEVTEKEIDTEIIISGWVKKHRDLGELIFIDIRDISGILQVVIANTNSSLYQMAKTLKKEYVVSIKGTIRKRQDINDKIKTGMVELIATEITIINEAIETPILIQEEIEASEETRMQYRYLDLRRNTVQEKLIIRHQITAQVRKYLSDNRFIEVETPILTKSTPEGARDYLVPSRVNRGEFYALPQSPQIYKNLLMVGGLDRYYQIAKCFRDEDLRADRQPEFTQIDIEMSFMTQKEIQEIIETMLKSIMKEVKGIDITDVFPTYTYQYAMDNYGVDKPDLRYDLKIKDVTTVFENSEFKVFKTAQLVRCIVVEDGASKFSRKDIDKLEEVAKKNHAKGMAWLKFQEGDFTGPIAKFLSDKEKEKLQTNLAIKTNSLVLFAADTFSIVCSALGAVRCKLARELDLIDENDFKFAWITEWPMFEYDEDNNRYIAMHHPFTMPKNEEFIDDVLKTKAQAYDVVLNGYEIGGGSIRINKPTIQKEVFKYLGFSDKEAEEQFGFLMNAYKYGAPYHGGIAFGLDRIVMILSNSDSIRDVIAFPKNNKAREIMIESPSRISKTQLDDISIETKKDIN